MGRIHARNQYYCFWKDQKLMHVSRNIHFWKQKNTLEKCTGGDNEILPPQQSTWWNGHGNPWSNNARVSMKARAMPSKCWGYLWKVSRSRPEKRNGRKGSEIEFKMKHKVEQQKTTQKSHSKLTFLFEYGYFVAAISSIHFDSILNRVVQKNGKKDEKFIEFIHFLMPKTTNQKKQNHQTYLTTFARSLTF